MRSSIMKSVVVAFSFAAILTLSAPAADATVRSTPATQERFQERFRDQDPIFGGGSPVQRVVRIIRKIVVIVQQQPVIPIP